MLRKVILSLLCLNIFACNLFALDSITIKLAFPEKGYSKAAPPKALLKPKEVSGNLMIDITPYPDTMEKDRYLIEYFLDGQLIYRTTGFSEDNPEEFSLIYVLDTTRFKNGRHKIIINFWDKSGPSAIGMREVTIKNEDE